MTLIDSDINCEIADEFVAAISPVGSNFRDVPPNLPWLFRGQGQDWPLVPSLFRGEIDDAARSRQDRLGELVLSLSEFFDIADRRGLVLPDDSQRLRSIIQSLNSSWKESSRLDGSYGFEALNELLSLEALAQHNGMPTRLIDWTRSPFIAAFFAAEDALTNYYEPASRLVVWAFYFPELGKHYEINRLTDPIQVVTAPSASNANLKAQKGVFTLSNYWNDRNEIGIFRPIDTMLDELVRNAEPDKSDRDRSILTYKLRKFSLPVSQACEVLFLLAKLDVTPSSVFPGFQSIRRDIQMKRLWEARESN